MWIIVTTWLLVVDGGGHGTTHVEDIATREACIAISVEYHKATYVLKSRCIAVPRRVYVYK